MLSGELLNNIPVVWRIYSYIPVIRLVKLFTIAILIAIMKIYVTIIFLLAGSPGREVTRSSMRWRSVTLTLTLARGGRRNIKPSEQMGRRPSVC